MSPKFDPHFEFDTPVLQDRAMKAENRLSATTTLTVNVMDSDDLDPVFEHDLYNAKVTYHCSFFTKLIDFDPLKMKNQMWQCNFQLFKFTSLQMLKKLCLYLVICRLQRILHQKLGVL